MEITEPSTHVINAVEDSRRWRNVTLRTDDIIISTPAKSGTTWTQGIVFSLLWPDGDAPLSFNEMHVWPDARFAPEEEMVARLSEYTQRRYIKSHSPATALPWSDKVSYIVTYRNPADALVSWANHRSEMSPDVMATLNAQAALDGVAPMPETWDGDYETLLHEWLEICNPFDHLASWWPRRGCPNVLFLHYRHLTDDLETEMRRIARFLDLSIDERHWPQIVGRCTLDSMRERARNAQQGPGVWRRGADSFFYKGGLGRGAQLLPPEILSAVESMAHPDLPPEALAWLRNGG